MLPSDQFLPLSDFVGAQFLKCYGHFLPFTVYKISFYSATFNYVVQHDFSPVETFNHKSTVNVAVLSNMSLRT